MDKMCDTHKDRVLEFVCLSRKCSKNTPACILCLKHSHKTCDPNLIIHSEELGKLELVKSTINMPEIVNHIFKSKADSNKEAISSAFRELKEKTLKTLEFQSYDHEDVLHLNNIDKLKQNYKINIQADGEIVFTPKVQTHKANVDFMIRDYKQNINELIDTFMENLSLIPIDRVHQIIKHDDFIGNRNLKVIYNNETEKILIKDDSDDNEANKLLIYKIPLTKTAIKISISIPDSSDDINLERDFVSVGVMNEKVFDHYKKSKNFAMSSFDDVHYVNSKAKNIIKVIKAIEKQPNRSYICPGYPGIFIFKNNMSNDPTLTVIDFNEYHLESSLKANQNYYFYICLIDRKVEVELSQDFSA